jgi:hypothetical protein
MTRTVLVAAVALLLAAGGVARADDDKGKKNAKLPKAVAAAVKSKFPKGKVVGVEKEVEDGQPVYEVKLRYKQGQLEVCLTPRGQVVKVEFDDDEHGDKKKGGEEKGDKGKKKSKKGDDNDKSEKGKKKKKDRDDDDDKGEKGKKKKRDDDDKDGE